MDWVTNSVIYINFKFKGHFKIKILLLRAHQNHFNGKLKEYNIRLETVDLDLKYFGFRWCIFSSLEKNF